MLLYVPAGTSEALRVTATVAGMPWARARLTVDVLWDDHVEGDDQVGGDGGLHPTGDVVISNVRVLSSSATVDAGGAARAVLDRVVREHAPNAHDIDLLYGDDRARVLFQQFLSPAVNGALLHHQ
ncbi:hypothetical protein [Leifsonia sp. 21MFCrub1.1]|uniref:hypothetical protein n=1 Tax=Leifsonia sp. 21MFCrub1.1 TaxID=1798223 RepID=UPI0008929D37|nr:hypothetical protein [Leifsonia sp. 21MFCrub1.1]SEB08426.1 hypothetical protein SAMN04515680_3135 [Leifsonia sp. 21MFCrub1.1]